ncbi:HSP12 [Candida pseudojiufengensis]|uniref:HSP12 n=1 Tax=Candida pseudojiufengensis TaxID=497109 RepID=UPI002225198B|nr:HSP12 [Candida pseudojiufengensis]KAI5964372.1 HSP12 [Candida pseudojiufengensis]
MSDAGRKPIHTKVSESLTPESDKSTLEKAKEGVTNKADQFAANHTSDNNKSFSQTVADDVTKGKHDAENSIDKEKSKASGEGQSLAETAQEYVDAAKEEISKAAEYVSGVVTGATEGAETGADSVTKK